MRCFVNILLLLSMFMVSCIRIQASSFTKENEYAAYFEGENSEWVHVRGKDARTEPAMGVQSDAYAIVGNNDEYIFAFVNPFNVGKSYGEIGLPKCGLYTNDSPPQLVYELPSTYDELEAEVSIDGSVVWFYESRYVGRGSSEEIKMSDVVMRRYEKGELTSTVKLNDIFWFKTEISDNPHGYCWAQLKNSTNDYFEFEKIGSNGTFKVDKKTGRVYDNSHTSNIIIICLIIGFFVTVYFILRKIQKKMRQKKNFQV